MLGRSEGTCLQDYFLIILKEVFERSCLILEFDELAGGEFGVNGDGVLEGVFGGQDMVKVDEKTFLVD
jgi:hypothetical protein